MMGVRVREAFGARTILKPGARSRRLRLWPLKRADGSLVFPRLHEIVTQLRASWVNRRWISSEELDEIHRGN